MEEQKIGTTKDYHDDLLHLDEYLTEHAAEIAAEGDKPFEFTDSTSEELGMTAAAVIAASSPEVPDAPVAPTTPAAAAAAPAPAPAKKEESGRESILQKIAKLNVGERVKLAMLGNKEERGVLIR